MSTTHRRLYFQHIPKTAGTSLTNVIRTAAADTGRSVFGPALLDDLLRPEAANWLDADVVIGHLGCLPSTLDPTIAVVTVLRDPVSHLWSWYRHVRQHPGHYFHRIVVDEGISFEGWLNDERFAALTDNPQARYLAIAPERPVGAFDPTVPHRVQQQFELQARTCSDADLEMAAQHTLRRATAVGAVERFDDFAERIAALLGHPLRFVPHENVGEATEATVSPVAAELVRQRCRVDVRLHAAVSAADLPTEHSRPVLVGQLSSPGCPPL